MAEHSSIKVLLAQINPTVGDIAYNTKMILDIIKKHQDHDVIIFPELAICGYPPEDLLYQKDFIAEIKHHFQTIVDEKPKTSVLIGLPRQCDNRLYNSVALIHNNSVSFYDKKALPDDSVFSESRFFSEGQGPYLYFTVKQHRFGVLICEDLWQEAPVAGLLQQELDTIIAINASPYYLGKQQDRLQTFSNLKKHLIYVNMVGGQDEVIFDGQSMVLDKSGSVQAQSTIFKPDLKTVSFTNKQWHGTIAKTLTPTAELYQALTLGLKDFLSKNRINKVVLGLSGGIDSALTLAIACEAIGASNVHAILMPSPHTAGMSIEDAKSQAETQGVSYDIIPIEHFYQSFDQKLSQTWQQDLASLANQNLQARIRGMILMAYANQHHALLLSTSNKSESAVGYCTLYGDMCGGFSVIKDVYKTQVYELAEYVNQKHIIIPKRVIIRAPSAELAPNQTDQDDLPPYALLDAILKDIIEQRLSHQQLLDKGYPKALLDKIYQKIKQSQFKRFQAPPGSKVSRVAFGRDWRFPIANCWKI